MRLRDAKLTKAATRQPAQSVSKRLPRTDSDMDNGLDQEDLNFMCRERPVESRWRFDDSIEPPPVPDRYPETDSEDQADILSVSDLDAADFEGLPSGLAAEDPWSGSLEKASAFSTQPVTEPPNSDRSAVSEKPAFSSGGFAKSKLISPSKSGPDLPVRLDRTLFEELVPEPKRQFFEPGCGEKEQRDPIEWYDSLLEEVADPEDIENAELPKPTKRTRLSHQEIIEGLAVEIILESGWTRRGFSMLVEALRPYESFSLVVRDLCRFLKIENPGLREFSTVVQLRTTWIEYGYSAGYCFIRGRRGLQSVAYKNNLDWSLALMLVRSLGTCSLDRIRLFLEDCFDDWKYRMIDVSSADMALTDQTDRIVRCTLVFAEYLEYVIASYARAARVPERRMPPELDYRWFESDESIPDRRTEYRDLEDILAGLPGGSVWDE